MKHRAFAFALGQRVAVPGPAKNIQGVIALPRALNDFPGLEQRKSAPPAGQDIYFLVWLAEDGSKRCGWASAGELIAAQAPPSIEARLTSAIEAATPMAKLRARRHHAKRKAKR